MSESQVVAPKMINITVDGEAVSVPAGTNLIEAARLAGTKIPYYCYHPDLSIAGNCRMCQVEVVGIPKLMIGCHTVATEGMQVKTHISSPQVKEAQASTLEMILINHPLDCTVCDQSGHCKLQDYHYEYNARPSRFVEIKEEKVKAKPLGPNVILDGERCIMCTRCIRFCDEITQTSELGMLNRGDRSVITVNPDRELDNALSGTVVDLCPVGALTHRNWRFNTRIWYTKQTETICPGCSTGCNVKVAVRDREVVMVKSRYNSAVNKDWLCDQGRYGFMRFLPEQRLETPLIAKKAVSYIQAIAELKKFQVGQGLLVLLSPDLLLEEYVLTKQLLAAKFPNAQIAVAYQQRKELSKVEKILVSPDYASNFTAALKVGLVSGDLQEGYQAALSAIKAGEVSQLLLLGDRAIASDDCDAALIEAISKIKFSVGTFASADHKLVSVVSCALSSKSILEKSGLMLNSKSRLQYTSAVLDAPVNTVLAEWQWLKELGTVLGVNLTSAQSERELTNQILTQIPELSGLSIKQIKSAGCDLA